eukprot:scaffold262_cov164-Ochromonas_danica.AAC.18
MSFTPVNGRSKMVSFNNEELKSLRSAKISSTGRLILRLTIGLRRLHSEIVASKHWSSSDQSNRYSMTEDHRLCWSSGRDDIFLDRKVAIKVMKKGYDILGCRERTFLDALESRFPRGPSYIVQSMCSGYLGPHLCLVMKYYPSTLIDLLQMEQAPSRAMTTATDVPEGLIKPRPLGIKMRGKKPVGVLDAKAFKALRRIALHLTCAIAILHRQSIIHGDLKPENCFVDADRPVSFLSELCDAYIRLGDFGNTLHFSELNSYFESFEIQSLPYRAPEVLLGIPFNTAIDVWSLGVILLELVLGRPLFTAQTREAMVEAIDQLLGPLPRTRFSGGKYSDLLFLRDNPSRSNAPLFSASRPNRHNLNRLEQARAIRNLISPLLSSDVLGGPSREFIDFISCLLTLDPDHRLSSIEALQHPFLADTIPLPYSLYWSRQKTVARPFRSFGHLFATSPFRKRKVDDSPSENQSKSPS